jgi:hypothetical protein
MMILFRSRELQRPGVEHGFESTWSGLVGRLESQQGDVGICRICNHLSVPGGSDLGDAFYVETARLPERKYLIMVG